MFPVIDGSQKAMARAALSSLHPAVVAETFELAECDALARLDASGTLPKCAHLYAARKHYVRAQLKSVTALQAMAIRLLEKVVAASGGKTPAAQVLAWEQEAADSYKEAVARGRADEPTDIEKMGTEASQPAPQVKPAAASHGEIRKVSSAYSKKVASFDAEWLAPQGLAMAVAGQSLALQEQPAAIVNQLDTTLENQHAAKLAALVVRPALVSDAAQAMRRAITALREIVSAGGSEMEDAQNHQHIALLALLAAFPQGSAELVTKEMRDAALKPVTNNATAHSGEADLHGLQLASEAKVHAATALAKLDAAIASGDTDACYDCASRVHSVAVEQRAVLLALDEAESSMADAMQTQLEELQKKEAGLLSENGGSL